MFQGGHRDRDRDRDYSSRSRSPYARRADPRNGDYRRSRKDSPDPPRDLNYDDTDDGADGHHHGYDRDHNRMSEEDPYADNSTSSRWNDASDRHSGRDAGLVAGLRGRVLDAGWPASAAQDEATRYNYVSGGPDVSDYPHPADRQPDASRLGRHAAAAGHSGHRHLRDPGGYGASVSGHRGGGASHDRNSMGRRHLGGSGQAVILDGLPEDATERDILYGLDHVTRHRHFSNDVVRIVRLRYDHDGSRVAIVEFHRRSDAEHFYDQYYPDISFPLEHSRGVDSDPVTVGVSLPRSDEAHSSRDSRRDDDGWDCINCGAVNYPHRAVCFKCKVERPEDDYNTSGPFLTGETDECPQQNPSQYVVVRDLEGSVSEEVLAKGVMKLFVENPAPAKEPPTTTNKLKSTAPTNSTVGLGAKPGSLRRVFLMRDRKTNESWRYGFAEFATVEDARAAVAKFRASTRFTIASKPVVVAFIHTGVFIPAFDAPATENQDVSFTPIYNPAVHVKYWDERAYPSVHVVAADPLAADLNLEKPGGSDEAFKSGARPSKKVKSIKEPAPATKVAMMPQMQLWAKASAELHGAKPATEADVPSVPEVDELRLAITRRAVSRELEEAQPDGPVAAQSGDQYLSYADWDALTCLACDWEPPSQAHIDERGWPQSRSDLLIEHEGRAHNFFRGDDGEAKAKAAAALVALGREPRAIVRRNPRLKSDRLPVYKSYADLDRRRCLLCRRAFKGVRLVWLHEQQSALHQRMLADPRNRARAAAECAKLGGGGDGRLRVLEPEPAFRARWEAQRARVAGGPLPPLYRDRALERRKAFGRQPNTAAASSEKRKEPADQHQNAESSTEGPPAAKKAKPSAAASSSKGAGMLAKMGWTKGAGLGAEGAGRTEAIATEVYAPGVGLGAEGGKLGDAAEEAARNTRGGFQAFVEKTRERARERFERLE